jgi:integrase
MGRGLNLLSSRTITTTTKIGKHADGGGLYLQVRKRGSALEKTWLFRWKRGGRETAQEMAIGLGPLRDVPLATAREIAGRCRKALVDGKDPRTALPGASTIPTFGEVADQLVDDIEKGFRNKKHIAQWRMTLGDAYCGSIRKLPVDKVGTTEIVTLLRPIWLEKPETASRLRGRIERVLDTAKARHLREGENPARWKGHLAVMLAKQPKLVRGHHKAVAWKELPAFMLKLKAFDSISALALEWTILTCARTSETTDAPRKGEINKETAVWTIPAKRMKAGQEHTVPLTKRCLEIIAELEQFPGPWLFPGQSMKKHISNMAMAECLKHLGVDATVHGFRSTFRDWVHEATHFPRELAEAALAHVLENKTEAAYRRGDALEKRREMMDAWERYCNSATAGVNVIEFSGAKKS